MQRDSTTGKLSPYKLGSALRDLTVHAPRYLGSLIFRRTERRAACGRTVRFIPVTRDRHHETML